MWKGKQWRKEPVPVISNGSHLSNAAGKIGYCEEWKRCFFFFCLDQSKPLPDTL